MPAATVCPNAEKWDRIDEWSLVGNDAEEFALHMEKCGACSKRMECLTRQHYVAGLLQAETHDQAIDQADLNTLISRFNRLGDPHATVSDSEKFRAGVSTMSLRPDAPESKHSGKGETMVPGGTGPAAPRFQRMGVYSLIREIGRGGMGVVWEARDEKLARPAVVKVLGVHCIADETARQRFAREGRALASVESEHVVSVYHAEEHEGIPYLAMALLEGANLEAWLAATPKPIPVAEILRIAREVLTGLVAVHAKGLIHRDITPRNIWIEVKNGRVKILDFGLTRLADGGTITGTNAVVGTPPFMSPEQATGSSVDARSDLFSLGVLLYFVASEISPFNKGTPTATLTAVANLKPDPLTGLPREVSDFIARLMSKNPGQRPQDAVAALAEVKAIEKKLQRPTMPKDGTTGLAGEQTIGRQPQEQPTKPFGDFKSPPPRRRLLIATASAAAAFVVIAILVIIIRIEFGWPGDTQQSGPVANKDKPPPVEPKDKKDKPPSDGKPSDKTPKTDSAAVKPAPRKIGAGALIVVIARDSDTDSVHGFQDNSMQMPHSKLASVDVDAQGVIIQALKDRCSICLDSAPNDVVWVSLDNVRLR